MNGIVLAQRPVNREWIGEERRLETLDVKVEGGLAESLLLVVGLSNVRAHRYLITSLFATARNESPDLLRRFPPSPKTARKFIALTAKNRPPRFTRSVSLRRKAVSALSKRLFEPVRCRLLIFGSN